MTVVLGGSPPSGPDKFDGREGSIASSPQTQTPFALHPRPQPAQDFSLRYRRVFAPFENWHPSRVARSGFLGERDRRQFDCSTTTTMKSADPTSSTGTLTDSPACGIEKLVRRACCDRDSSRKKHAGPQESSSSLTPISRPSSRTCESVRTPHGPKEMHWQWRAMNPHRRRVVSCRDF